MAFGSFKALSRKGDSEEKDNVDVSTKFKCFKCKDIVSIEDKFNDTLEKDQMCKLCTMIQAYG